VKMKMGAGRRPVKDEAARLKAIREAVGENVEILIDAHWSFSAYDAVRLGREIEAFHPYWLEDPVGMHNGGISLEDVGALAQIAAALEVPVATGETFSTIHGFRRIFEQKAADIIIVDVLRCGGITEWMKVAAMAEAWNLPIASHCVHDVSAHVIAAIPNGLIVEYMPWWDVIYREPPRVKDGCIKIPDRPGLGLELDADAIKKYRIDQG
jgi:L-alanine-DL-glutamate epimerase-like enolase superfamily enzyme